MQAVVVEDIKDIPTSVDVHVRMEFDESGNLVCQPRIFCPSLCSLHAGHPRGRTPLRQRGIAHALG